MIARRHGLPAANFTTQRLPGLERERHALQPFAVPWQWKCTKIGDVK
jgi:hypothetical protein